MREQLQKRDSIRDITRTVLDTYGKLTPKLQHLDVTPLPDKTSVVLIVDDILEVLYPGYFGAKGLERSNIDSHIKDLLESIFERLTEEIYRSIRPDCNIPGEPCSHCRDIAEDHALDLLHRIPEVRRQLAADDGSVSLSCPGS